MNVKEDLISAKALIADPENWGRGFEPKRGGKDCAATACTMGRSVTALVRALPSSRANSIMDLFDFNDAPTTTHADIMALFDRAIAAQDDS